MLAQQSQAATAVHLHTDDFFNAIVKGYIEPWRSESQAQNATLTKAIAAAAEKLVIGGFEVIIDGVIGPWFLPEYQQVLGNHTINYVVLRPDKAVVAQRARDREVGALTEYPPRIWEAFQELGELEGHALDSELQSVEETLGTIKEGLLSQHFELKN